MAISGCHNDGVTKTAHGFMRAAPDVRTRIVRAVADAASSRAVADLFDGLSEVALLRAAIGQGLQARKFRVLTDGLPRVSRICESYRSYRTAAMRRGETPMTLGRFATSEASVR